MTRRQVATRLIVASIVLLTLFIILAGVAYLKGRLVEQQSQLITSDAVPGTIDAHALRGALSRTMGYSMLTAMTENQATDVSAIEKVRAADALFTDTLAKYRGTMRINPVKDQELVDDLLAKWAVYRQQRIEFDARVRAGRRTESYDFMVAHLLPSYEAAASSAEGLLAYNHTNTLFYAKSIEDNIRTLRWTVVVVLVLAAFCVVILLVNLDLRLRQQREVRESEQRLRRVLDNLFVFVGVLDLQYNLIEVNRAPLDAAGLRREDVIGKKFDQTPWWSRYPDIQAKLQHGLQEAAAGRSVRYDVDLRKTDDSMITVDFGCGPLRDEQGRVTQLVVIAVDISERKKLEHQFLRAQRLEAIGTLSSGLAHDLNNILAPMLMCAPLLKSKLDSPSDQRLVTMIESSTKRGADIIRQLLTFGRGAGNSQPGVQLRQLVRDMEHIMQETFPRNIELSSEVPANLRTITANTTQLHQVLLNLCVNARDAMPGGGKLSMTAANVALTEPEAKVHAQAKPGRYVVLTVADTGEGIPQENIKRIFEAFFTTKPVGKGTGLGLASVLGIAKGHGGFVTVDSEAGTGSCFKVYLPADKQAGAAAAEALVDQLPRGRGELILLVDDEKGMLESTRVVLESHNYQVLPAGNGAEATGLFIENRGAVKLVLTDVDMPVMGGEELIRSLKILERDMKFMVMSGSQHAERKDAFKALGINDIIEKPCEPKRLLTALQEVFQTPAGS